MKALYERLVEQLWQPLRQKGSFAQNFAITLSGSAAVTVIGFLLTPVMSRIYPPSAYGQFAVFNSLVNNLAMVSTLTYTVAFLQPKEESKFHALVQLTGLLTLVTTVLMLLVLVVAGPFIRRWLHIEGLGNLLFLLPVLLMLFNLNSIMSSWYTREKKFMKRVSVDITTTLAGRGFTIGYGWVIAPTVVGLLLGDLFNRLTSKIALAAGSIRYSFGMLVRTFSWANVRAVAIEYKDFPLYFLPANFLNGLSAQLPIYVLTTGFGSTAVGLYSFSVGLLELPITLIGNALMPVFWQKATETHQQNPERLGGMVLDLYYKMLYLGLIPFGVVTIYGDLMFKFVFGPRWEMAGVYTSYLGYYYVFRLMSQVTAPVFTILNRQRFVLGTTIVLLLVRALTLGIGLWAHSLNLALLLFGVGSLLATFFLDLLVLGLLKLPILRIGLRTVAIAGTALLLLKGSRMLLESFLHLSPALAR